MGDFDFTGKTARRLRFCYTHAATAELFAASAPVRSVADAWNDAAKSWKSLADLKRRMMESDAKTARLVAELTKYPESVPDRPAAELSQGCIKAGLGGEHHERLGSSGMAWQ